MEIYETNLVWSKSQSFHNIWLFFLILNLLFILVALTKRQYIFFIIIIFFNYLLGRGTPIFNIVQCKFYTLIKGHTRHLQWYHCHFFFYLTQELQELHSALEEAKADIVGLWALKFLIDKVSNFFIFLKISAYDNILRLSRSSICALANANTYK